MESGPKPFQLMLTGTASVDKPLRITPNPNLLIHHLRSINIENVAETKRTFSIFNKLLDLLNVHLLQIYYNDSGIVFMHSVLTFMKRLRKINENFLSLLLVRASLVYVESAKFKYQRKNMHFNSIHVIDKCGFKDMQKLKQLMKMHKLSSKTSGYFGLFFTPIGFKKP